MKLLFSIAATLMLAFAFSAHAADHTIVMGVPNYEKDSRIPELEAVLSEAYARAGKRLRFLYFPPKRVVYEIESGHIDGCALITEATAARFPDLFVIRRPITQASLVAFVLSPKRPATSWEDLKGHIVGTMRGSIFVQDTELAKQGIVQHTFNDAQSAFRMLQDGRLDYLLGGKTAGEFLAKELNITVTASPPLKSANLYHAVNRQYRHLIPQIEKAFTAMMHDGTMHKLLGKYQNMLPKDASNQ